MPVTLEQAQADLKRALECIQRKRPVETQYVEYYDGDQPLLYLTARLREVFSKIDVRFNANFCALVIDSVADRIQMQGAQVVGNDDANAALASIWRELSIGVEADDLHEQALIASEAYLLVWREEEGDPIVCYHDPRTVHVEYEPDNPKKKRFACKLHFDQIQKFWEATLYYPDELWYFSAPAKSEASLPEPKRFVLDQPSDEYPQNPAVNPFDTIPVFHFKNKRCQSDLKSTIPLQDAVNKLLADMMAGSEFQALPQRYIIAQGSTKGLKNSPNEIWEVPAGDGQGQDTSVGQFSAADLKNFLAPVESIVTTIGAITRTPKHYFLATGGDPSGEALIAMEAPLVKKATDRIDRFRPEWRHALSFLLFLAGFVVEARDIEPTFANPATVQPKTEAEVRSIDVATGIPLTTTLKRSGWSTAMLEQMQADKEAEQQQAGTTS